MKFYIFALDIWYEINNTHSYQTILNISPIRPTFPHKLYLLLNLPRYKRSISLRHVILSLLRGYIYPHFYVIIIVFIF